MYIGPASRYNKRSGVVISSRPPLSMSSTNPSLSTASSLAYAREQEVTVDSTALGTTMGDTIHGGGIYRTQGDEDEQHAAAKQQQEYDDLTLMIQNAASAWREVGLESIREQLVHKQGQHNDPDVNALLATLVHKYVYDMHFGY